MNQVEKFFTQGFSDQLSTMGTECTLIAKGKRMAFKGVLVQKSGDTQVELAGANYIVDANALIPDSFKLKELISSILECYGSKYFISAAVKDPFQRFWSCSLTRID